MSPGKFDMKTDDEESKVSLTIENKWFKKVKSLIKASFYVICMLIYMFYDEGKIPVNHVDFLFKSMLLGYMCMFGFSWIGNMDKIGE